MFRTDALNSSTAGTYVDKNDLTSTPGTRIEANDQNIEMLELEAFVISSGQTLKTSGDMTTQVDIAAANYSSGGGKWYEDTGSADDYELLRFTSGAGFTLPSLYFDGMDASFIAATTNTGPSVLAIGALADKDLVDASGTALAAGNIVVGDRINAVYSLSLDKFVVPSINALLPLPRGFIDGLIMSNDSDADHDISVSVGACRNSSNITNIVLPALMVKRIDAAWAALTGNGGLFTGSVAIDTWYHMFAIKKDSDGSIDAGFDTSITAANIPAGYTQYRYIGSVLTDGSANILPFYQNGNWFLWDSTVTDVSGTLLVGARTSFTLSTPIDVRCEALFNVFIGNVASTTNVFFTSLDVADEVANDSIGRFHIPNIAGISETGHGHGGILIWTNASSQIGASTVVNAGTFVIGTTGYKNLRGKDS